jgi:protein-tyrosine phosphatase
MGIYLQVNANSILSKHGKLHREFMLPVLDERLIDFVSTDAHDIGRRRPELSAAACYVEKCCGRRYMEKIFSENAKSMLRGESF